MSISITIKMEITLGIRNFSRNLTSGVVTKARSRDTVKGRITEEVIFKTAAKSMAVITDMRKKITRPELKF